MKHHAWGAIRLFAVLFLLALVVSNHPAAAKSEAIQSLFLPLTQHNYVDVAPVIPETTEVLPQETLNDLVSISEDGVLTFSEGSAALDEVNVGDVIVGGTSPAAPYGFLRKVTGISQQNGQVIITSEGTVLEEAVEDGSITLQRTLNPADVIRTTALPGVTRVQSASEPIFFYYEVNDVVLYDDDDDLSTTDDQIKANGTIEFEMDFEFYINIEGFTLRNITLANRNTLRDTIEIVSELELASVDEEFILASHDFAPITVAIGPVPVVFVPSLDVVVGVDGSVKVGISTSLTHELSMRAGVVYKRPSGWHPIAELTDQYFFTPPSASLEATLKGYFGARFNLYLYGVAGPYVKVTPFLELKITPLETPWWVLYGGVDVPAGFRVVEEVKEIGEWLMIRLDDYEIAAIGVKEVIAQAETTNHAPNLPSNPTPANLATGISLAPTLSWIGGDPDGDAVEYDVYFEAGDSSPDVLVSEDQAGTTYTPGTLAANTTYYWQIIATDGYGWSSASAVWRFTTVSGGVNPSEEVYIQAGEFQMGCDPAHNNGYSCNSAELPLHTVYLDAYYIDQYEVTNAQYEACVAAGSCTAPSSSSSYTRSSYYGNPTYANYPVIYVNWSQATAYCTWAGRRLPSEAEWEKAARGTTVRAYPWGDASPTCDIVNFYDDLGTGDFCVGDTSAVGSYPAGASQFGALDMAGNVWEWVNDWYDFTYYSTYPAEEWPPNPQGPASGTTRVQRGGSFVNYDHLLRNAYRYSYTPAYQSSRVGFRCARTP